MSERADVEAFVPASPPLLAFGPDLTPRLSVSKGSRVRFATLDACSGTITGEDDVVTLEGIGAADVVTGGNPASGPIEVRGARPGDSLVVDILSIEVASTGFVNAFPGIGPLGAEIAEERTWVLQISSSDGSARRGALEVPLRPMIGVIGVATDGETIANDFGGAHGGNLDNRFVAPGARVYLPVRQPGAMLALGDVHAAMGDGELTGSGLEVAAEVVVSVDILPNRCAGGPIVEVADAWYVHGVGRSWDEAATRACRQAAAQLEGEWALAAEEVPLYLALAGDLGICQAARPGPFPVVARLGVQKSSSVPSAFRDGRRIYHR